MENIDRFQRKGYEGKIAALLGSKEVSVAVMTATLTSIIGRMATYTGKEITWEQAMNSTDFLVPENLDWNSAPPVSPDQNGRYPIPVPGRYKIN